MISYHSNDFYSGLKIILDNEPYTVESSEFVKPGKGRPFVRVRLRRLLMGTCIEKTFKSTDIVVGADVIDVNLIYLYKDNEYWYFLNQKTCDLFEIDSKVVGNNSKWLTGQEECVVTLWNNHPISITPPRFVKLKIINTDTGSKGDTIGTSFKQATLSTGAVVKVPLFIQIGEVIKIDTRSGEYVSRIK